jgi:hypothetical protein
MSGWDDVASSDWEKEGEQREGAFLISHFQCPLVPPYPTRPMGFCVQLSSISPSPPSAQTAANR